MLSDQTRHPKKKTPEIQRNTRNTWQNNSSTGACRYFVWKGDRRSLKIFGAKDSDSTSSLRCYFFFPFSVPLVLNLPSLEITFRQTQSRQPIHFRHGRYFTTQTGLYQLPLPDSSFAHVSVVYHCSHGSTFICSARVEGPCHHDWVRPHVQYLLILTFFTMARLTSEVANDRLLTLGALYTLIPCQQQADNVN